MFSENLLSGHWGEGRRGLPLSTVESELTTEEMGLEGLEEGHGSGDVFTGPGTKARDS